MGTVFPAAAEVGRFRVALASWNDVPCTVAGTGYTGESGIEISVPAEAAEALWAAIVAAGVTPAGLGARDTLRLEAGLPLHGHELGPGITSLQAGLGWVVAWDKPSFRGREAARAERARRHRSAVVRSGHRWSPAGACRLPRVHRRCAGVGAVTSGNFSPTLGRGIAFAFLPPDTAQGQQVVVDVRGKDLPGHVVATPFVG